jgi:chaperone LolA
MKMKILIGLLLFLGVNGSAQESPQRIIGQVEKALKAANTLKVEFTETFYWELTGENQSVEGTLILGQDDRFHITTTDQVIVSDGNILWTYSKPANRVLIDVLANSEDTMLPRQILFQYKKDYTARDAGNEKVNNILCTLLEFTPDSDAEYITKVRVWIDRKTWLPRKLEQTDLSGDRSVYDLTSVKTGIDISKDLFQFKPPQGAEVIDMR